MSEMKRILVVAVAILMVVNLNAQDKMTPELLWKLGRVSPTGISKDGKAIIYKVTSFDIDANEQTSRDYRIPVEGGSSVQIQSGSVEVHDKLRSPSGAHGISIQEVKIQKVFGQDHYPELDQSDAMVYDDLMYRHWDTWEDGKYSHIFLHNDIRGGGH